MTIYTILGIKTRKSIRNNCDTIGPLQHDRKMISREKITFIFILDLTMFLQSLWVNIITIQLTLN